MGKRILLVEDHDDTRAALSRLLTLSGYAVTAAAGVRDAIAVAAQGPFDVLLCDIGLPDGEAADVLRAIAQRGPVRAVALTGFGMPDEVDRIRAAGFHVHLLKPALVDRIIPAIEGRPAADAARP